MVQLSNPYMSTRKNIALTIQTFVRKVMSLLFNMMSRLVIVFVSRSKRLHPLMRNIATTKLFSATYAFHPQSQFLV